MATARAGCMVSRNKWRNLPMRLVFLVFISSAFCAAQSDVSPTASDFSINDLDILPRNATNELEVSVNVETLSIVMEKSGVVLVNFTLYCTHPSVRYSLSVLTESTKVAVVDRSAMFNLSCADATMDPTLASASHDPSDNTAGAATTSASGDTGASEDPEIFPKHPHEALLRGLPTVRGSFNFSMYGDLLGRTWLQILGQRSADPDVYLPEFLKLPWTEPQSSVASDGQTHRYANNSNLIVKNSATGESERPYDVVPELQDDSSSNEKALHVLQRHVVTVKRVVRPVDIIFRSILYGFVMAATVGMGCKTELSVVKKVLKKPVAPAIGFVCQYLFMPLIAFMLAKTLTVGDPAVSLGIFACGICPGGGPSNMFTYLLDGDVSLSVTMTAISSIGALAMIPVWLFTLGATFQDDKISLTVPFGRIIMTLLILIVPLFIGILLKHKMPKVAKIVLKLLKPVTLVAILFIVTFGIYANLYVFRLFAPRTLAAGCLLPYIGYTLGGLTSLVFRQPCYRIKTIAIETGIQNTSIAYLLLVFSLPTPDGDMAAVGPAASAIMTPLPLLVLVIVYLLYKRFCKKKKEEEEGKREEDEEEGEAQTSGEEDGMVLKKSDEESQNSSMEKKKKKKDKEGSSKNGDVESEKFLEGNPDNRV